MCKQHITAEAAGGGAALEYFIYVVNLFSLTELIYLFILSIFVYSLFVKIFVVEILDHLEPSEYFSRKKCC